MSSEGQSSKVAIEALMNRQDWFDWEGEQLVRVKDLGIQTIEEFQNYTTLRVCLCRASYRVR